jgi:hypothetical protein
MKAIENISKLNKLSAAFVATKVLLLIPFVQTATNKAELSLNYCLCFYWVGMLSWLEQKKASVNDSLFLFKKLIL